MQENKDVPEDREQIIMIEQKLKHLTMELAILKEALFRHLEYTSNEIIELKEILKNIKEDLLLKS